MGWHPCLCTSGCRYKAVAMRDERKSVVSEKGRSPVREISSSAPRCFVVGEHLGLQRRLWLRTGDHPLHPRAQVGLRAGEAPARGRWLMFWLHKKWASHNDGGRYRVRSVRFSVPMRAASFVHLAAEIERMRGCTTVLTCKRFYGIHHSGSWSVFNTMIFESKSRLMGFHRVRMRVLLRSPDDQSRRNVSSTA